LTASDGGKGGVRPAIEGRETGLKPLVMDEGRRPWRIGRWRDERAQRGSFWSLGERGFGRVEAMGASGRPRRRGFVTLKKKIR
jgi:hypothetical protein